MNRQYELNDPIRSENLKNNINVAIYDLSKRIAGDRWFIRICCVATLPMTDTLLNQLTETGEVAAAFKKRYADGLTLEVVKERNFVDEQVKDDVVQQIMDQISENSLNYMNIDAFPHKLLRSEFEKFKIEYFCRREIEETDDQDEEDGPADFSGCFKD